jgi:hypothetical protein
MASFRTEWGRLLVKPWQMLGGLAAMIKFLGPTATASVVTAIVGIFGNVSGWTLPLVAFVSFYLSWTAGMAWERATAIQVEVGPLKLEENKWGDSVGIFYVWIENEMSPAKIKVSITDIEYQGIRPLEHPWEGHWRGMSNPDGRLDPGERAKYGLIGISSYGESGNPCLFVFKHGAKVRNDFPKFSPDVPLEQQSVARVEIAVNWETANGKRGKLPKRNLYIAPDRNSPVGYSVAEAGETTAWTGQAKADHGFRWYFDRLCTTVERIFGSRHHPPS